MSTAQRAKLKTSPELYKLTVRIDANTRAVAKVISAAEYLGDESRDAWPLWASLEVLLHERRGMRQQMWREFERVRRCGCCGCESGKCVHGDCSECGGKMRGVKCSI